MGNSRWDNSGCVKFRKENEVTRRMKREKQKRKMSVPATSLGQQAGFSLIFAVPGKTGCCDTMIPRTTGSSPTGLKVPQRSKQSKPRKQKKTDSYSTFIYKILRAVRRKYQIKP
jgi:hypothetical protein